MGYLDKFELLLKEEAVVPFLRLWEEYCMIDTVDFEELATILLMIKNSNIADSFGQFAESALSLWQKIEDRKGSDRVFALIIDLQTTNSPLLADLVNDFLKKRFGSHKFFNEMLRASGARGRSSFKGCVSFCFLLNHMVPGNFVFHNGGWGVGEIIENSFLRDNVLIEFEGLSCPRELSFNNVLHNLQPLDNDHFLARRFGNADKLEEETRKDPVKILEVILRDFGPSSAQDFKEYLSGWVIPEKDWAKWWQNARAKIKKESHISTKKQNKDTVFVIKKELSFEDKFKQEIEEIKKPFEKVVFVYNFSKTFPSILKDEESVEIINKVFDSLSFNGFSEVEAIAKQIETSQIREFLFSVPVSEDLLQKLCNKEMIVSIFNYISVLSVKKELISKIVSKEDVARDLLLLLLFSKTPAFIREIIVKELSSTPENLEILKQHIIQLPNKVAVHQDAFLWFFNKMYTCDDPVFDSLVEERGRYLEGALLLLHMIENLPEYRDLAKKIYIFLTGKRFSVFRSFIENGSVEFLKETLLLSGKCHTFSKEDLCVLQSLAEVVQPSLIKGSNNGAFIADDCIWTTREGYQQASEKLQYLANHEVLDNAKEIEEARAHGDLRENSEYKFALERRSRLQSEIKSLSTQVNKARILTEDDIDTTAVGPGIKVSVEDLSTNKIIEYVVLGPWDTDPDKNIISYQSKLAKEMYSKKENETFEFQNNLFKVVSINSFFN